MSATDKPYGWRAVPRNHSIALQYKRRIAEPVPFATDNIDFPDTELVLRSLKRMQEELSVETLNYCFRIYYYGMSIIHTQFPHWLDDGWLSLETWALVCLFHDIEALRALLSFGADKSQAESVAEAIIRHQNPGETGTLSCVGLLVQISTLFDNAGHHKELVHPDTIKNVVENYPRNGWSGCFAKTIRQEIDLKPWAHSTAIDGFAEMVENNALMEEYE